VAAGARPDRGREVPECAEGAQDAKLLSAEG